MSRECPECAPEINLRHLSPELYNYLVDLQAEHRKQTGKLISLERVIFKIISDHRSLQEQGKFLIKLADGKKEKSSYRD